jgi:2-oxoglutarate ferredoxin oxidoreductase subunit beta
MVITLERTQVTAKDFKSNQKSTWCPGCGDFGILSAIQTALVNAGVAPWQAILVSGIGCGSKLPDYINANGYMTLHGRAVTIASGVHLANTDLVTFAITGDGDGFGIGIGHVIHNMRRNKFMD